VLLEIWRQEGGGLVASLQGGSVEVKDQSLGPKAALGEGRSATPLDEVASVPGARRRGQLFPAAWVPPNTRCRDTLGPTTAEVGDREVQTFRGKILTLSSALEGRPQSPLWPCCMWRTGEVLC